MYREYCTLLAVAGRRRKGKTYNDDDDGDDGTNDGGRVVVPFSHVAHAFAEDNDTFSKNDQCQ